MTTTLNKVLIATALSSLAVIACNRPQGTRVAEEQPAEFAESGNARCALNAPPGPVRNSCVAAPVVVWFRQPISAAARAAWLPSRPECDCWR